MPHPDPHPQPRPSGDATGPNQNQPPRIAGPVLFLCRSPFQAMLVERIVEMEGIGVWDVIYYGRSPAPKDTAYFARLAERARDAVLLHRGSASGWLAALRIAARRHRAVFLANHTFSLFRVLASRKGAADFYSFDEGGGNFDPIGALQTDKRTRLERLRDHILRAPPATDLNARAVAHYTVDTRMQNVAPPERLREVVLGNAPPDRLDGRPINLIIGQPFAEYLTPDQVTLLNAAFSKIPDAFYVPHPRQSDDDIPPGFTILRDDRIVEEVVFSYCGEGRLVRVIGCSTTVFGSVRGRLIEKYSLEPADNHVRMQRLEKLGCTAIDLGSPDGQSQWTALTTEWSNL